MKDIEKFKKKLFTKNKAKDIINKNYNPLKVNCKIYKRGSGLYNMKNVVSEEIRKELDLKGRIILYMFPKTCIKIYKLGITFGFNNKWIAWKLHENYQDK